MKIIQVVAAYIRQEGELLLVQQQGPHDPTPHWALPAGVVEAGELLTDALVREVLEETGLQVRNPGHLVYVVQHANHVDDHLATTFCFEIGDWTGTVRPDDPDHIVLDARFLSFPDAISQLESTLPLRVMREPIIAYLRGEARPGGGWFYRTQSDGVVQLVTRLD